MGHAGILTVAGAQLLDGQTFTLSNGTVTKTFEFDKRLTVGGAGNGVAPGHVAVLFSSTDLAGDVATAVAAAINGATSLGITAAASTSVVSLTGTQVIFSVPTQTTPPALVNLGAETVVAGQTVSDVDFGDYKAAHVSISNVAIAEGNSGQTQVKVTVSDHRLVRRGGDGPLRHGRRHGHARRPRLHRGLGHVHHRSADRPGRDVGPQAGHPQPDEQLQLLGLGEHGRYQGSSGIDNDIYSTTTPPA